MKELGPASEGAAAALPAGPASGGVDLGSALLLALQAVGVAAGAAAGNAVDWAAMRTSTGRRYLAMGGFGSLVEDRVEARLQPSLAVGAALSRTVDRWMTPGVSKRRRVAARSAIVYIGFALMTFTLYEPVLMCACYAPVWNLCVELGWCPA